MPTCRIHAIRTISRERTYHGWPTVERLDNGELLVVSSSGRERHVCPFGQVHLIRSADDGATWSTPHIVVNGPLDDRDAGILQTTSGALLVNWFTSLAWLRHLETFEADASRPPRSMTHAEREAFDGFAARCRKVRSLMTDDVTHRELGTWMIRSTDGGQTWSDRIDCGVGSPHGPTQLDDGRLLFVGRARAAEFDVEGRGSPFGRPMIASESCDEGRTWTPIGDIPHRPKDGDTPYVEPHAAQAADGRVVVHIRHEAPPDPGHILQSESDDGGRTFSVPHDTGLFGFPAHLRRLRDGRLLTTYGYRRDPYGNRVAVSEDSGRSWSDPLVLDAKDERRDLGYPSTVELADGRLVSVWYERLPGDVNASLQAATWSLED